MCVSVRGLKLAVLVLAIHMMLGSHVMSHMEPKKALFSLVLINEVIGWLQSCLGWYCTRLEDMLLL